MSSSLTALVTCASTVSTVEEKCIENEMSVRWAQFEMNIKLSNTVKAAYTATTKASASITKASVTGNNRTANATILMNLPSLVFSVDVNRIRLKFVWSVKIDFGTSHMKR